LFVLWRGSPGLEISLGAEFMLLVSGDANTSFGVFSDTFFDVVDRFRVLVVLISLSLVLLMLLLEADDDCTCCSCSFIVVLVDGDDDDENANTIVSSD
jgi:hypothetical protein